MFLWTAAQSATTDVNDGGKKHTDALYKCLEVYNKPKQKSWNTAARASPSTSFNTPNTDQSSLNDYVSNTQILNSKLTSFEF